MLVKECFGRHYHSGRTESALDATVFQESFLDRMKFFALRKALDRQDLFPLGIDGKNEAGLQACHPADRTAPLFLVA
jgi:hypothetical protein